MRCLCTCKVYVRCYYNTHCTSRHRASFVKKWGADSVQKSWQAERKERKKLPIIIMQILIRWGGVVYRLFNFSLNFLPFTSTVYMLSKRGRGWHDNSFFYFMFTASKKMGQPPPHPHHSYDQCPKYHLSFKIISIVFATFHVQPVC